jgi:nucleoside-diphosphate-sugar epimerase
MRLLVTGVGGLIGRHVAAAAAADPDIALVVTARRHPGNLPRGAEFHAVDLADPSAAAALARAVAPTHIVHTAWETRHPTYWEDMANLAWVDSAAAMARAFAEGGGERFVQLGSCAQYDWSRRLCVEHATPDRPATRYGKAKSAAFRAVEAAAHGRFAALEARPFFVYGPGENPARFVPYICRSHLEGRVPALGSGRQWRDMVHARDAASALLALVRAEGLTGTVNIGTGVATSLAQVATLLAELAGASETGLGRRPDRVGDPELLVAGTDRLRSTGWLPQVTLRRGLADTFAWWRGQLDKAA